MKKILLAFEGTNFSEDAYRCAIKMNELQPILLTGIFLPLTDYSSLWSYGDAIGGPLYIPVIERNKEEIINKNIAKFENLCQRDGIDYKVHNDSDDFALPELRKEARFADLLILGSESFFENRENTGTKEPNLYLQDAMHTVECPVLVVPEKFEFPSTNLIFYDGSESSVYAMKQFAYLFPEMKTNSTLLVYINKKNDSELPEKTNIKELASLHFPDLTMGGLESLNRWIKEKKNSIIISGSYGRSLFSRVFKKSFISGVIKQHNLPVFITHR